MHPWYIETTSSSTKYIYHRAGSRENTSRTNLMVVTVALALAFSYPRTMHKSWNYINDCSTYRKMWVAQAELLFHLPMMMLIYLLTYLFSWVLHKCNRRMWCCSECGMSADVWDIFTVRWSCQKQSSVLFWQPCQKEKKFWLAGPICCDTTRNVRIWGMMSTSAVMYAIPFTRTIN